MKYIYTRPDGGVSIILFARKEDIERILGPLTDQEYLNHVLEKSLPNDYSKLRELKQIDMPESYEFRDAWCDVTPEPRIDIDLTKAKEIKLAEMRLNRKPKFEDLDKEFIIAMEKGDDLTDIKLKKQKLRDATNPLKALVADGYNDETILNQIIKLGTLED